MSALSTQLAVRADELLGDGKWHPDSEVIRELSKLVPPGIAIRRNDRDRRIGLKLKEGEPLPPRARGEVDVYRRIRWGARSVVREFLNGGAFETRVNVDVREVRQIRPHRSVKGERQRIQIDLLRNEVELLRDQLDLAAQQLDEGEWRISVRGHEGVYRPQIVHSSTLTGALRVGIHLPHESWQLVSDDDDESDDDENENDDE